MKIATWNIERPTESGKRNKAIIQQLNEIDADILILTESNHFIHLGGNYKYFHTSLLSANFYKEGERRVSIYSKYNSVHSMLRFEQIPVFVSS